MKGLAKLIKCNMISFKEVFLANYKKIALNDQEAMTILHLYQQTKLQDFSLSIKKLTEKMSLPESAIDDVVVELINKGYIDLSIDNQSNEMFSLSPTIDRLGSVLEQKEQNSHESDKKAEIIDYLEKIYQHSVKPDDLSIINQWISENYSFEDVKRAIMDGYKNNKKTSLRYIDAILVSHERERNREQVDINPEIKDLLGTISVRRKYN